MLALAGASVLVALYRRVLAIPQRPSWPPPPDAVTSDGAQAAIEARAPGPLDFAWSTAATIEPWVEGASFFPRIFADVEAATSSVHILMFGWREGTVGTRMAELLKRKLAEGVEVRVLVDRFGSRPYGGGARDVHAASPRRARRSSSATSRRSTGAASSPIASGSSGRTASSAASTIASCTWSTARSRGPAAPASRITSRTAASTT